MSLSLSFTAVYLDGSLAGLSIPQVVTCADRAEADRRLAFYARVEREGDFIRATGTGNRYRVTDVRRG